MMRRTEDWSYEPYCGASFWERLVPAEQRQLDELGKFRTYEPGTVLLHQGVASSYVMVLRTGTVKVAFRDPDARELTISILGAGDIIGELEALDEADRSATVTTLEEVHALVLAGQTFRRFLEQNPRVWPELYLVLAGRLRENNRHMIDYSLADCKQALARILIELADRFGEPYDDDGAIRISLPLSQDELASLIWKSRHTVAHELDNLRRRGIVATGRRHYRILSPDLLRQLAT